jgi:hypothetical protein
VIKSDHPPEVKSVVRRDARGYRAQAISSSPPLGTGCLSAGLLFQTPLSKEDGVFSF